MLSGRSTQPPAVPPGRVRCTKRLDRHVKRTVHAAAMANIYIYIYVLYQITVFEMHVLTHARQAPTGTGTQTIKLRHTQSPNTNLPSAVAT